MLFMAGVNHSTLRYIIARNKLFSLRIINQTQKGDCDATCYYC